MKNALITGASRGLGRALAGSLVADGWRVIVDARSATDLHAAAAGWPDATVIPGDITDDAHRHELAAAVGDRLDLLVLNASSLGQAPLPPLAGYQAEELRAVLEANTVAPLLLIQPSSYCLTTCWPPLRRKPVECHGTGCACWWRPTAGSSTAAWRTCPRCCGPGICWW